MSSPLAPQGGDTSDDVVLDLSSCVNPYGPPPSVAATVRSTETDIIKHHPFRAPEFLERAYAKYLGVPAEELIGVRGASEAIWQLARLARDLRVSLPAPTYTEYLRAFPDSFSIPHDVQWHTVEQLAEIAAHSDVVVFSNPHNPTGRFIEANELASTFARFPETLFVVDESYADFLQSRKQSSIVGINAENAISFNSPSKFFGLGGVRVGAIWTKSQTWRQRFLGQRTTWPISMLEARLVAVAFNDTGWQQESRKRLAADALWLDNWLSQFAGVGVVQGPLHFRLVTGETALVSEHLAKRHVRARELEPAHGVGCPALRIAAPRFDQRDLLS